MTTKPDRYIPALNRRFLTPLYDPVMRLLMREQRFRTQLLDQARLAPGMTVLDLGCGTGTLAVMIQQRFPGIVLHALDGDPQVLDRAREKARQAGVDVRWQEGLAGRLPYPDGWFDRVVSSLMVHHLTRAAKRGAFQEAYRVLKDGGELHIADFGPPHTLPMQLIGALTAHLEEARDNLRGDLLPMLAGAGFSHVQEQAALGTVFGPLSLYRAIKPVKDLPG
jgi:ubiquinone/menaquinone biosynthesis C-methylase UbiE